MRCEAWVTIKNGKARFKSCRIGGDKVVIPKDGWESCPGNVSIIVVEIEYDGDGYTHGSYLCDSCGNTHYPELPDVYKIECLGELATKGLIATVGSKDRRDLEAKLLLNQQTARREAAIAFNALHASDMDDNDEEPKKNRRKSSKTK